MRASGAARWVVFAGALLGGCAQVTRPPVPTPTPAPAPATGYESVQGRGPDVVARLRAAPPPAQPDVVDGTAPDADEDLLRARGLVKIGVAHYPPRDAAPLHAEVLAQARKVGADEVHLYSPQSADAPALANFFVRLHLPFGANFRDLNEQEQQTLGVDGVEIGEVVGGTPAAEANLRDGDYVLKFNKTPVHGKADFQSMLQSHLGRRVTLTIRRDGVTMKRLVVLGTLPAPIEH
ncbi:MAG: PDZ domain-containing protein [Rudaea sp.]